MSSEPTLKAVETPKPVFLSQGELSQLLEITRKATALKVSVQRADANLKLATADMLDAQLERASILEILSRKYKINLSEKDVDIVTGEVKEMQNER